MVAVSKPFRFGSRDNNPAKRPGRKASAILGSYKGGIVDTTSVLDEVEQVEREVREQVQQAGTIGTVELFDNGYKDT